MTHEINVFDVTHPELERLYTACVSISNEAFSISDLGGVIKDKSAKLGAALKDAFRFTTTWDYSQPIVLNHREIQSLLRRVDYTDISEVVVYKPVGFKGYIYPYAESLNRVQIPALINMVNGLLKPAQQRFGYYLNNLENLSDRRTSEVDKEYSLKSLEMLKTQEAEWVIPGNRSSEANFEDLFQNCNECGQAMELVNHINRDRWKSLNPKQVAKHVDDLQIVTKALVSAIHSGEHKVSVPVIKSIAEEIELVARWTEWYSAITTRVIDLTTAMKLTEKKLRRAL